jgi:hypothetical protein
VRCACDMARQAYQFRPAERPRSRGSFHF